MAGGVRRHLGCGGRVAPVDTRRVSSYRCHRCRAYISEIQTSLSEEPSRDAPEGGEKRRGPDSNR